MQLDAIAQRYADALFHWATEERAEIAVAEELATLDSVFGDLGESFYAVMANPSVLPQQKQDLLAEISGNASIAVRNLLSLLVEHQRMMAFPEVVEQYTHKLDEQQGRVRGTLITAAAVNETILKKVADAARQQLGVQEVILTNTVDERLFGGAQLQIGDKRIDGSYLSQLNALSAHSPF